MSWKETDVMDERMKFVVAWRSNEVSFAELCRQYGVSRRVGYKLVGRYLSEGPSGLVDRSRAPHHHPNEIDEDREAAILALRAEHPTWGPKKLKEWLARHRGGEAWPACSTIAEMLSRHGLVPLTRAASANQVWAIDFKGWFRTGDARRCDPLTVSDLASRYILRLQAVDRPDGEHVWPILEATFREAGLPELMRSDNGPPFGSTAAGGLSWLAVRLIKAGVKPEHIKPGRPDQNGSHERMHRTVKQETASPPAANRRMQQRRFDEFRRIFNEERPHEALAFDTPAEHYRPSLRSYSGRLREPEYPADHQVRRVHNNGDIKWLGGRVFLSEALIGEPVGIAENDHGLHIVHYGPILLGYLDRTGTFRKGAPRQPKNPEPPIQNV